MYCIDAVRIDHSSCIGRFGKKAASSSVTNYCLSRAGRLRSLQEAWIRRWSAETGGPAA
jgi:hypothetical protein